MTDILMTAPMHPAVAEVLERSFTLHRLWEQTDQQAFLARMGREIRGLAGFIGVAGQAPWSLVKCLPLSLLNW